MSKRSTRFALVSLAAVLVVCTLASMSLGQGASPIAVLPGLAGLGILLVLLVRHPAAFIVPMLFTPRSVDLPLVHTYFGLGPYKALTAATVLVALAMVLRLLRPGHDRSLPPDARREWRNGIAAFLVFASVISLSFFYTASPDYGADKLWRFLIFGSLAFLAPFALMKSEDDFRDFTIGGVMFGVALAVSSLRFSHQGRIGPQQNIVHIGVGQVIGLAILLLIFYRAANRRLRALTLLACIPLLAFGLGSAEARGPALAVVIALAIYVALPSWAAYAIPRKRILIGLLLVAAMTTFVLSTYWFRGVAESRFQSKTTELIQILKGSPRVQGSATERLVFYRAAPGEFLRRPLFGLGIGGWSMGYFHQDTRLYPHNLLLEVGLEEGIVGLAALFAFLGIVFFAFKKNAVEVAHHFPALFPALVYLFLLTMFSGDIVENRFLWFGCGMVLAGCGLAATSRAETEMEGEEDESLQTVSFPLQDA